MYMNVLLIAGALLCIWMLWWIFKPYTLDELLMLPEIYPETEQRSLAEFARHAKTKEDLEVLWDYVFRYPSVTGNCSSLIQFHYLLWLSFQIGDDDDFALAKLAATGSTGIPFEELMFPAQTFVDK